MLPLKPSLLRVTFLCILYRVGWVSQKKQWRTSSERMGQEREESAGLWWGMVAEWNERHEASYLLSSHHLYRPSDIMKWRKFLCVPKIRRRPRSKARSEISPIEVQNEVDSVVSPPTVESTPDLPIGASTLPASSPLTVHDRESNGKQTT